jgi:PPOX class probable F420-dependent enzyme
VSREQGLDFLAGHHRAVLATTRRDGATQLSPVSVAAGPDGVALVSTRQATAKVHNVRRDPRVALCVLSDAFFGPWMTLTGTAEIQSLPEAMEPLVEYYRTLAGEHPDWADYRAAMERERRCLLRITVTEAGPDRQV